MAKSSGTTKYQGSSASTASKTIAVKNDATSYAPLPLSSEEKDKFAKMEALNEDAINRYNKYAKVGGILKQKANSDANKSRKAMDDIRYNRPAIVKTLKENGIESSKPIGKTGSYTLGYTFEFGAKEIRITGQNEASIMKIVNGFNKNGASVASVDYSKGDAWIRFKKRI